MNINWLLGCGGMWLFCDGWISLSIYVNRLGQSWVKDHSIRIIRMLIGLIMMVMGYVGH